MLQIRLTHSVTIQLSHNLLYIYNFAVCTGNSWLNRKNFVKHPNKFYPLEIDYGQVCVTLSIFRQWNEKCRSMCCDIFEVKIPT